METSLDLINAKLYAYNCTLEFNYNKFLNLHPHIFKYVTLDVRPATHNDYYIPPAIANQCKIVKVSFNKIGCEKIACFPRMQNFKLCDPPDEARYLRLGTGNTLACQPACTQLSMNIDTEFKKGKCMLVNSFKKMFALFPESLHGVESIQPLHFGLNLKEGNLELNAQYCAYYGLNFKSSTNECYETPHQKVTEFFIGSSIYRYVHRKSQYVASRPSHPPVPHYLQNVNEWLEGTNVKKRRKKRHTAQIDLEFLSELSKDIAIDIGVDLSLNAITHTLKTRVPNALTTASKLAINTAKQLKISALADIVIQSHFKAGINISKILGSGISVVNWTFLALSIFGIVFDIIDIFNFNNVLDKNILLKLNERFDFEFYNSNKTAIEVTPDIIWDLLEEDLSEQYEYMIEKMQEYLNSLNVSNAKERILIQKRNYNRSTPNFGKTFHIIIVLLLIIFSILFVEQIAYFSLFYFMFIMYSRSFINI